MHAHCGCDANSNKRKVSDFVPLGVVGQLGLSNVHLFSVHFVRFVQQVILGFHFLFSVLGLS
jgi:hypothetical protein